MSAFTVWVVAPAGDVHFQGLAEAAKGIWYALGQLGHECTLSSGPVPLADWGGRLIVFNAHRLNPGVGLPDDAIIFNAEQVQSTWAQSPYLALLRQHQVWDYCETNRDRLKRLGVERVAICRIGYWPGLANLVPVTGETEEIDVLFVGSVNERRAKLLVQLSFNKLRVKQLFAVYGEERDRWIARSKIVLNAHFYPEPVWEIFRCSHLLANKKCVVSEGGGVDRELEDLAAVATAYAPYDQIVNTCVNLARDEGRRREIAERGHRVFTGRDQVEYVRQALEVSS